MKIAYLINQYPLINHSFIRREIAGLEACGIPVARFSIRSCSHEPVEKADKLELEKTRSILGVGIIGLFLATLRVVLSRPIRFVKALGLTFKIGWRSDRGCLRNLIYLAEACVLLDWLLDLGITQVHAHFGTNSTTVAMLCHALGGPPYSFTIHGPEEFDKATILGLDEKIQRSSFVVAISSFGKSQLYRWCNRQYWSKIHVIHCTVDEIFLRTPRVSVPEQPRFVCVGRLAEQKGHLVLIEAVARLAAEGLQFKLVLVGDGPLRSEIESMIARFGLENHVEIIGWASNSEVKQQILNSRAMVLSSFAEGLPVVIMEALALGRPVITTHVAGVPELVEDRKCGWLVTPGSVEALTVAMRTALQSPVETLEQMGKAGATLIAQRHNITIEAEKLAALFQSETERSPQKVAIKPEVAEVASLPRITTTKSS
ncbi:MAG: glycosyltransferase [Nostocaceae cyanobacterium]|nr:glycosyltransferase [Nostocaceae cyanobacterium]